MIKPLSKIPQLPGYYWVITSYDISICEIRSHGGGIYSFNDEFDCRELAEKEGWLFYRVQQPSAVSKARMKNFKEVPPIKEYEEHHFKNVQDVGIAFNGDRVWICFDGASIFRAKLWKDKFYISYDPPTKEI